MPSPFQPDKRKQREERFALFPSLAYYDARREIWRAHVQGRVYDVSRIPISTRILLKGLKRALKASEDELAGDIFRERIEGFTAKPVSGRRIHIELHGSPYALRRRSRRNGAFFGVLKLPSGSLPAPGTAEFAERSALRVRLLPQSDVARNNKSSVLPESTIHLVGPQGVSVVSDIDDTIKSSDVSSRQALLANTFLRPFMAVEGMASLYQRWQESGANFHYVSSSPWQLFQPLAELWQLSQFPEGSMHLRYFRIRDEMFKRWRPQRRKGKAAIIAGLIKKLPQRRFVLVGDSGERDAEIYRFLARKFPAQVQTVLIRQLSNKPLSAKRIERLKEIPSHIDLRIFHSPAELSDLADQFRAWSTW